jgi:uncharacterized protein YegP (UPF0339 family)
MGRINAGSGSARVANTGALVMAGKFVIKKASGPYHFVLKAGNGEIIATSERYTTKAAAKNGIESVKTNAPTAKTEDETGE